MSRNCYNCMQPVEDYSGVCPHCGQAPFEVNPVHQLKTGTFLKDRYLIGKSLGQGGFGITYIGLDTTLDVRVAVKEYYPNGISNRNHEASDHVTMTSTGADVYERGKLRFLQEAKTLARFYEEPGIVSVHDFFEDNNTAYIVMEYLDGITLKRFVEARGKIPANKLFRAMRPIMRSLEKVHAQDVIHRDISPDNIMLLRDGTLKLLDFGSAREVGGDKSLSVMLKPGFAPEEQYRSKGKQGPWTDIYALCATMYYCLTGVKPEESVERMVEDTLRRPSELGADITQAQESVILRGMAVHARERYQSMAELLAAMNKPLPPVADSHLSPASEFPASLPDLPGGREIPKPNRSTKRTKTTHAIIIFCGFLAAMGLIAGGMKVFGTHESDPAISEPVPTPVAMESPSPTIAVIANAEKKQEPMPELIPAENLLSTERKEIGSGTFRSLTGVPLNIKAQWTAETIEENKVAVTVTVFLESYSILTLAEQNALHVRVGDSYVTADVPALNIDDNTDIHSSLLAITEHVCVLPEDEEYFDVRVDYNYHGTYFNKEIETISCGGIIIISHDDEDARATSDELPLENTITASSPSAMPNPISIPIATPSAPVPVISKQPTSETHYIGESALFIADANTWTSSAWTAVAPDGTETDMDTFRATFPNCTVSGDTTTSLKISGLSQNMTGWSFYCTLYNFGSATTTDVASLKVLTNK